MAVKYKAKNITLVSSHIDPTLSFTLYYHREEDRSTNPVATFVRSGY